LVELRPILFEHNVDFHLLLEEGREWLHQHLFLLHQYLPRLPLAYWGQRLGQLQQQLQQWE
jgi:hypothetical protein